MVRDRRGFALVEVLVALIISGVVVLLAHQLFAGVAERGRTLTVARTALDRAANARRWLEATFLSLDVGTEGASGFDGRPDHLAFTTWLLTPDAWFERRGVSLARPDERLAAWGGARATSAAEGRNTGVTVCFPLLSAVA